MINIFYFSHARTAFKYGIKALGVKPGDEVLFPDFICSVLIAPINQLGIKVRYYFLKKDLTPDWSRLEKLITKNTKALLMVHYFGQPQNIVAFRNFCEQYSLFLIEDNAHGLGGTFDGKLLGTLGDIGFSSPRKFFNIYSGGVLYWNREDLPVPVLPVLPVYKVRFTQKVFKQFSRNFPCSKRFLKVLLKSRPPFEDPFAFQEGNVQDMLIDLISLNEYLNIDWDQAKTVKQKAYIAWGSFSKQNDLEPLFSSLYPEASPQCFPAYVKSPEIAKEWFDWGWKHGHHVYSWPALPREIIKSENKAFFRWKHLVCFSTNSSPKNFKVQFHNGKALS